MWNAKFLQIRVEDLDGLCIDRTITFIHPAIQNRRVVGAGSVCSAVIGPGVQKFEAATGSSEFCMEQANGKRPLFLQTHESKAFPQALQCHQNIGLLRLLSRGLASRFGDFKKTCALSLVNILQWIKYPCYIAQLVCFLLFSYVCARNTLGSSVMLRVFLSSTCSMTLWPLFPLSGVYMCLWENPGIILKQIYIYILYGGKWMSSHHH